MSQSTNSTVLKAHQKQQSFNSQSAPSQAKLKRDNSERFVGSMLQPVHSRKKSSMLTQVSLGDLQ